MPGGREPEGGAALTNAERQARWRARRQVLEPPPAAGQPKREKRRSRARRWNDALAELRAVQAECTAWFEALPDGLRDNPTAEAPREMMELALDTIAAVQPPRGYGRD